MPEIIGPDGQKYYSEDHFATDTKEKKKIHMPNVNLSGITDYVYLIGGWIAILWGLFLLADIAIGLILLFLWSTGVNYWMMKHKR